MDWVDIMALTGILFYLIPIAFIVWFLISFIKTQKERNIILRDISLRLDKYKIDRKEE
ncbi:hypothetical protein J7E52_09895 [Bacillus sp. ISL-34]|uniref:hypothetical protein n=1 Tax=Bacillus sp. ISL-34 TaxID=2819121 RepID=UPI001BE966C7|nr:hypothetical protein [Bacillus sp. ISL-34]MBT2647026.1 hypothetical protein [Bacillus sp. ISL-34]